LIASVIAPTEPSACTFSRYLPPPTNAGTPYSTAAINLSLARRLKGAAKAQHCARRAVALRQNTLLRRRNAHYRTLKVFSLRSKAIADTRVIYRLSRAKSAFTPALQSKLLRSLKILKFVWR